MARARITMMIVRDYDIVPASYPNTCTTDEQRVQFDRQQYEADPDALLITDAVENGTFTVTGELLPEDG